MRSRGEGNFCPSTGRRAFHTAARPFNVDYRAPCAERKSQAYSRLGRLGAPGDHCDHSQPKDIGRCPVELSCGLGDMRCGAGAAISAARDFVARLYRNVPVLDVGARAATTTFVERGNRRRTHHLGNEALLAVKELGKPG